MYTKLLGIISMHFDILDQLVIRYCKRNWSIIQHQLFRDFKKACDSESGGKYWTIFSLNLVYL
jgi:hypothetical protein